MNKAWIILCVAFLSVYRLEAVMDIAVHLSITINGKVHHAEAVVLQHVVEKATVDQVLASVWHKHRMQLVAGMVTVPKGQYLHDVRMQKFAAKVDPTAKTEIAGKTTMQDLANAEDGFKAHGKQLFFSMEWRPVFLKRVLEYSEESPLEIDTGSSTASLKSSVANENDFGDVYSGYAYAEDDEYDEYEEEQMLRELMKEQRLLALQRKLNRIARRYNSYYGN
eukprot:CAMPEP_0197022458 /NCGR_PEP_ID=MMETSP1384-20130603/3335_1 /TAXON_ID=29189 /ORGANISM="Ammonia sp." /LENGTH=221 /DNA_ID=CAMNT_0042450509 /DNA_START=49 /DNA_END=714 /DNA_ORIENTATION=-